MDLTERFVRHISSGRPIKERKETIHMENKQDKGFTLVELLIVIVILGILATVTVFAVRGITDKGQENACAVEARTLSTAIEAYYADNDQTDPGLVTDMVPNYLKEVPDDAKWTFVAGPPASFTAIGVCAAAP
jgi:prepilin-type N-terminal cleavage/methylation domain-containing protein